jgi:peptide/nickel transport system permease protein
MVAAEIRTLSRAMITAVRTLRLRVRRLISPRLVFPIVSLHIILSLCFLWPSLGGIPDPVGGSVQSSNLPFLATGHFLGTDLNGNDVWSRLLHGGRASLQIALAVNLIGLLVGGFVGGLSGQVGGLFDSIIMRTLDVLIAFPPLVLVIAVAQTQEPSQTSTIWALSCFSVPAFARVARAATLGLRERPFMVAAEVAGSTRLQILARHIAPNALPQLAAFASLGMGIVIVIEGALSFLGLGVPTPYPTWGNMIAHGYQAIFTRPSLTLLPSAFLFATVLSFNLLGRSLHEKWNGQ